MLGLRGVLCQLFQWNDAIKLTFRKCEMIEFDKEERMELEKREKIVIIGAAILDILVSPAERSVFDTGSFPADAISMSFGGDALNEATVLSALGKKVYLITVIGDDHAGTLILDHCARQRIELVGECSRVGLQTGINVVLVQENGERNFLTNRNGSLRKLRISDIPLGFPEDAGILCFASIFVFPEIGCREMADIFKSAKDQGLIVCADMTKRKNNETLEDISEALKYVDYLMPNEEEAFLITGEKEVPEAAEAFLRAGVGNVVIKCGKRGCYICDRRTKKYVPAAENVKCIDTTGAGDSFAAGFLYGLSEGWSLEACAVHANRCGAYAVSALGATDWCQSSELVIGR